MCLHHFLIIWGILYETYKVVKRLRKQVYEIWRENQFIFQIWEESYEIRLSVVSHFP